MEQQTITIFRDGIILAFDVGNIHIPGFVLVSLVIFFILKFIFMDF